LIIAIVTIFIDAISFVIDNIFVTLILPLILLAIHTLRYYYYFRLFSHYATPLRFSYNTLRTQLAADIAIVLLPHNIADTLSLLIDSHIDGPPLLAIDSWLGHWLAQ